MASSPPPSSPTQTLSSPTQTQIPLEDQDPYTNDPRLSPLEAEVLNEYLRLKSNLDTLSNTLQTLSTTPSTQIADGLRTLERQMMPVCNAFKSSVYQIVMAQQVGGEGDGGAGVNGEATQQAGDVDASEMEESP